MPRVLLAIVLTLDFVSSIAAQNVPEQLIGKWRVRRILPAKTISCWGEKQARELVGTEIEYTADSFRWKDKSVQHPSIATTVVTADKFRSEYSGSGSLVDFRHLGIGASQATKVHIVHAPAKITGGSSEIPGDDVLIRDRNTIVFSVCNVYFEAKRELVQKKTTTH